MFLASLLGSLCTLVEPRDRLSVYVLRVKREKVERKAREVNRSNCPVN